jgi:hypothetical protein
MGEEPGPGSSDPKLFVRGDEEDTFDVGRETIEVDEGLSIGIYSAGRSLIDAFRLRRQKGDEAKNAETVSHDCLR